MSKLRKFIKTPGLYFRDMLLNRYPLDHAADINRPRKHDNRAPLPEAAGAEVLLSGFASPSFDVDIVYTWVDAADPAFQRNKAEFLGDDSVRPEAAYEARFKSRDELRYSLRSIYEFAPWVRKIYIVTNGQTPHWLDTSHEKISIVTHGEIIDKNNLPTFNSHVIESCIHKISNLSEHYIYFNDDVLLLRQSKVIDFFTENGLSLGFVGPSVIPEAPRTANDTPSIQATKNARDLIHQNLGHYFDRKFAHTFHPQRRSVAEHCETLFRQPLEICRGNRFRSETDILCTSFLYPCMAYTLGKGAFAQTRAWYFNIRDLSAKTFYTALLSMAREDEGPLSVCINDHINLDKGNKFTEYESHLSNFLTTYYPKPAPWELI
ncbi:Stealth CR1 domain-containing protein [Erythrobacteraceae bacterium E2-1 Yellow Sea]|nr:Stealth CR1 domain-containing protein [Erythrobacteraceae bacterium E2-1 Yellow Sea]